MPSSSAGESLWDAWARRAAEAPHADAVVHWVAGEPPRRWARAALLERALRYTAALRMSGVRAGEVCALVLRHDPDFYPLYAAVVALGAIPAVLAYPNPRLHPDKFRDGIRGMSRRSGLTWLLTERELEFVVAPLALGETSTVRGVLFPLERRDALPAPAEAVRTDPDAPALLQHSSGTTGLQKAVVLSHRAVLEHVQRYGAALRVTAADRVVSWLPLYHDMGLIAAFHLPLAAGIPTVQLSPFEWVVAPSLLLEAVAAERGTLVWQPNFAYNLEAERVRDDDLEGVRLDSVRAWVNCSEPVRAESHERFLRRFGAFGVMPASLGACYAMAETTFAVTQTPPGGGCAVVQADRDELTRGRFVPAGAGRPARACVSSGQAIDGCAVRIVEAAGGELPDGVVGELVIASVSLFDGYRNNAEATTRVLRDGWYRSGDVGFRLAGEVFVIGRQKDIIIVAGKNLYPEDIEDAVGGVPGIVPGRVIAFGVFDEASGTEQVCVVAETERSGERELRQLRRAVIEAGMAIDVTLARVQLVPPRWLIKSSSGKPSRSANRERMLATAAGPA